MEAFFVSLCMFTVSNASRMSRATAIVRTGRVIMFANFLVCEMMFYMLVRYVSPRGLICFRCLMFNLSGPVELLFLFCSLLGLSCCYCNVM